MRKQDSLGPGPKSGFSLAEEFANPQINPQGSDLRGGLRRLVGEQLLLAGVCRFKRKCMIPQ